MAAPVAAKAAAAAGPKWIGRVLLLLTVVLIAPIVVAAALPVAIGAAFGAPSTPQRPSLLGGVPVISGEWAYPLVPGYSITDRFGPRDPVPGCPSCSTWHRGLDLASGCGSTIFAASAGTVEVAEKLGTYGNYVRINHGGGVQTLYAHMQDGGFLVGTGDTVTAGQPIGLEGSTGGSTGCHLHYEVRLNGERIDPVPFMAGLGLPI